MLMMPPPSGDHRPVFGLYRTMLLAAMPPAVEKLPPKMMSPFGSASEVRTVPGPDESAAMVAYPSTHCALAGAAVTPPSSTSNTVMRA